MVEQVEEGRANWRYTSDLFLTDCDSTSITLLYACEPDYPIKDQFDFSVCLKLKVIVSYITLQLLCDAVIELKNHFFAISAEHDVRTLFI